MIEGSVNACHEAVIPLRIQGPDGRALEIDAVVDTGYQGLLSPPAAVVSELDLTYSHMTRLTLADDTVADFDVHYTTVLWNDEPREILADIAGSAPLIGMLLLDGYSLRVDVKIGGRVVIDAAP